DAQGVGARLPASFGWLKRVSGEILTDGKPTSTTSPRLAKPKQIGMALTPEDPNTEGLMLPMAVCANLSFAAIDRLSRGGIIDRPAERKAIDEMIKLLAIRTDGVNVPVGSLSRGNQQKAATPRRRVGAARITLPHYP